MGNRIVQFFSCRLEFPNQAVIESKLFEAISPQPIRAAIAYMSENRPFRQEDHGRGRGAHAFEVVTCGTTAVDLVIGVENRRQRGIGRGFFNKLMVG
jgi:hypothetical protein